MIKKISINILKILSSILISAILVIAVGLWRLSEEPLQLRPELLEKFAKIDNLDYGNVYLKNPDLSALPIITIDNIKYSSDDFEVQSEQVSAQWNIFKILYGTFDLNSLKVSKPIITIRHKKKNTKNKHHTTLPESVTTLHSLLDKVKLPAKNIHIKNGKVYFYKRKKKVGKIEDVSFRYTTHRNHSMGTLRIKPSVDASPIILSTLYSKNTDTLEFKLKSKDFRLQENYLPYRLRPLIKHVGPIIKKPFSFYSEGTVDLSGLSINGKINSTLTVTVPTEPEKPLKISIENDISVVDQDLKIGNKIKAEAFDWKDLPHLWPSGIGKSARSWVLENMVGGTAQPATINFDVLYDISHNKVDLKNLKGTVGVDKTTLSYYGDLPKIKNTTAEASFTDKKFDINILSGDVYDLTINTGNVLIYDLDKDTSNITIDLGISGPLRDALEIVNKKPLEFLRPYGISPKSFNGDAKINLKLDFPLIDDLAPSAVKVQTKAHISNLKHTYKLGDKNIPIDKGNMTLDVSTKSLKIEGDCELAGNKGTLLWKESFEKDHTPLRVFEVTAKAPIQSLAKFAPGSVEKYLNNNKILLPQGLANAKLVYDQTNEKVSSLDLNLDLSGNVLDIKPLNIRIPKSKDNTFKALFHFMDGNLKSIEHMNLTANPVKFESQMEYDKHGNLQDIAVKKFDVKDKHLKISGSLIDHMLSLKIKADEINLQDLMAAMDERDNGKEEKPKKALSHQKPKEISGTKPYQIKSNIDAEIKTLQLKDGISLPNVMIKSKFKNNDYESIIAKSATDKKTFFDLFYGPKENQTVFEFKTETLSDLLSGFGIHNDIKASLLFTRADKPLNDKGPMVGKLKIKDLHVKNAPILAKIFNLMSLESLLSTLTGQGMLFMKGSAEYEYKDKNLAISKSSLTSSGIGLTAQGYVDLEKELFDIYGVVIPANVLNQAITGIPLIGDILTAGETEDGLISTSYTLKGPMADPKISANPLSILAPTLVKRIFFGIFGSKEKPINISNFPDLTKE